MPSGKRRDNPVEPFKRAVTTCMRAISGDSELEVVYASDRPSLSGKKARLPEPPRRMTAWEHFDVHPTDLRTAFARAAGMDIPLRPRREEGQAFAIEPFATDGRGRVVEGNQTLISPAPRFPQRH